MIEKRSPAVRRDAPPGERYRFCRDRPPATIDVTAAVARREGPRGHADTESVWLVEVHINDRPSRRFELVLQVRRAVDEWPDFWVALGNRCAGRRWVLDDEGKLTRVVTDGAPELFLERPTHTPQHKTVGCHFWRRCRHRAICLLQETTLCG